MVYLSIEDYKKYLYQKEILKYMLDKLEDYEPTNDDDYDPVCDTILELKIFILELKLAKLILIIQIMIAGTPRLNFIGWITDELLFEDLDDTVEKEIVYINQR